MFLLIGTVYGHINGIFSWLLIIILCHAIANVLKASVVGKKILFTQVVVASKLAGGPAKIISELHTLWEKSMERHFQHKCQTYTNLKQRSKELEVEVK